MQGTSSSLLFGAYTTKFFKDSPFWVFLKLVENFVTHKSLWWTCSSVHKSRKTASWWPETMNAFVFYQKRSMTVLYGLRRKYEQLIVAVSAVADDDSLTMDLVKSWLVQERNKLLIDQKLLENSQFWLLLDGPTVKQQCK